MLKCLVYYVAFHPDNYQGGSGKSFKFRKTVEVPNDVPSAGVVEYVQNYISEEATKHTAYSDQFDFKVAIQKIEVLT